MDPLSALSLAGTVVQFVDFGTKLLLNSKEIYSSTHGSAFNRTEEVGLAIADLEQLQSNLATINNLRLGTSDDLLGQSLERVVKECQDLSGELLEHLTAVQTKAGSYDIRRSFKAAFKAVRRQEELDRLGQRLSKLKAEFNLILSTSLR
jgi:hypothetical protein